MAAGLSEACAAHARLGPASLVLYDVSTLYFEADRGDGFREPGFSKERCLEPQITIGLLAGQDGFPLMVSAFEGNRAEGSSSALPAATAPSRSAPASTSSPPKTRSRPTSAKSSPSSSNPAARRVSNPRSGDCPGDERQHEPRDDDRHPRIVQPVPALVLLAPVGGVMVGCPRSGAVVDRDEQGDRHDDAHDEKGRSRDGRVTGRPAPFSGGQPGREEQGPDVPERHHAAEHPGAIGAGLNPGPDGQPPQDRADEDRDSELDANHDAEDGCGDDSERSEHGTPFLAMLYF
jgi:hypothetical protein